MHRATNTTVRGRAVCTRTFLTARARVTTMMRMGETGGTGTLTRWLL